ncbi:hypothetical protein [Halodesulfovibrio aestuarii]|uniref:Uncharacterized protein n=1 Tax=Halodesulfovibrio aestuarii TaxID=126333 RepID=A0A8G2FAM2_9BACT|nr:hypothetical protein [Halodesulfovibrio aestuarii]SHI80558.1 hypothetical protein SAMN05660830_01055 [Halodesulfovibrio aestuarii]
MNTAHDRKKKAKINALLFGAVSVALYSAAFYYADPMVELYAKGGAYCLLPVATVFLFSYVHGNFASNVWTALGIEASSSAGRKTKAAEATPRKETRTRATVNA